MEWKVGNELQIERCYIYINLRPRLHGTGRIWDRSEIRPFSPVYTREFVLLGGLKFAGRR